MSPEAKKEPGAPRKRGSSSPPASPPPDGGAGSAGAVPERENGASERPSAKKRKAEGGGAPSRAELLAALGTGLEEVLPGLRLLDRDLEFEEGARADLAGADRGGRLVLVLLADEDADRTALRVLDTLAYAVRHRATIARHLPGEQVRAEPAPRLVVIDPHASERLRVRLVPLFAGGVELFGLQSIHSAGGERSYLVRCGGAEETAAPGVDPIPSFVASLPSSLADLGREAVARISRIDRELVARGEAGALAWNFRDGALVRLELVGQELRGSVGPHFEARAITREEDLDPLLEKALARLVQLPELDEEGDPGGRGGVPEEQTPLLTAEEIDYFRD